MYQPAAQLVRSSSFVAQSSTRQLVSKPTQSFQALVSYYVAKERVKKSQERERSERQRRETYYCHCTGLKATTFGVGVALSLLRFQDSKFLKTLRLGDGRNHQYDFGSGQSVPANGAECGSFGKAGDAKKSASFEQWLTGFFLEVHSTGQWVYNLLGQLTSNGDLMQVLRVQVTPSLGITPQLPSSCFTPQETKNAHVAGNVGQLPVHTWQTTKVVASALQDSTSPAVTSALSGSCGNDNPSESSRPIIYGKFSGERTPRSQGINSVFSNFERTINIATPRAENALGLQQSLANRDREAASLFSEASSHGYAKAQYNLGVCYNNGRGVPQNTAKAAKCFQKAAMQGHAKAMYNLGVYHTQGEGGCSRDLASAAELFQGAAEKGLDLAQHTLALCYEYGRGVHKDQAKAIFWYEKAASQGHPGAHYHLAQCYAEGRGLAVDLAKAASLNKFAMAMGHRKAPESDLIAKGASANSIVLNKKPDEKAAAMRGSAELLSSHSHDNGVLQSHHNTVKHLAAVAV